MEMPEVHRPIPRRAFDITPTSSQTSLPPSPPAEHNSQEQFQHQRFDKSPPPSRSRSILNLTASTLTGIYSAAIESGRDDINTPWGPGAQTPAQTPSHRASMDSDRLPPSAFTWDQRPAKANMSRRPVKKGFKQYYRPLLMQTIMLFGFGMAFGTLLTYAHKTQRIAPIPVPTSRRNSQYYQVGWGILGVVIGNALPQIDTWFEDEEAVAEGFDSQSKHFQHHRAASSSSRRGKDTSSSTDDYIGPLWYAAVRSIGAFVGIAYALRKIPWQSTLQVSLTLAVVNPVLWYLIDRSKSGFSLSLLISACGTFLSLLINPRFVPMPHIYHEQPSEKLGVFIWLASILFCTSLCFGAIGRRLQL